MLGENASCPSRRARGKIRCDFPGGAVSFLDPTFLFIIRGCPGRRSHGQGSWDKSLPRRLGLSGSRAYAMDRRADADAAQDVLLGLLALQRGLIDQAQLLAAFQTWTGAKDRSMAE